MDMTIEGVSRLRDRALRLHTEYSENIEGMTSDQALAFMANSGDVALGMLPAMAGVMGRLVPRAIADAPRDGTPVLIGYSDGRRPTVIAAYGKADADSPEIGGMEGWMSLDGDTVYAMPDVYMPLPRMTDVA